MWWPNGYRAAICQADSKLTETVLKLTDDVEVMVDGKAAKLSDVPKGSSASFYLTGAPGSVNGRPVQDPTGRQAFWVDVTGGSCRGVIKQIDASTITITEARAEKKDRVLKLSPGTFVVLNDKKAKLTDLKVGDRVNASISVDQSTALSIHDAASNPLTDADKPRPEGTKPAIKPDGDKPKPERTKPATRFGGAVASVDVAARTITLATKTDSGAGVVITLTADAKVFIDGKEAKLADVPKGSHAAFVVAGKDGVKEASEVRVTGETFSGVVRQVDSASLTIATKTEKPKGERVVKPAPGSKIAIDGKEAKLADLQVGDKVTVTLTADASAALSITTGVNKPKPDKDDPDDDQ